MKKISKQLLIGLAAICAASATWADKGDVILSVSGMAVKLDNGLAHFDFAADASAKVVGTDEVNLVDRLSGAGRDPSRLRSFHLDYNSRGVTRFQPESLKVIEQQPERAHVAWIERQGKLDLEYHLIMEKGEPGLYSYVLAKNSHSEPLLVSELRTIYRFNPAILDHLYTLQGSSKPPLYGELEKMPFIQDETWRLADGYAYSKYNLVDYQRKNEFWGAYGNGYGAWFIPVNHDYYSGGPLKQDLMVHQDAIVLNYMTGAHMGTPDMMAPPGWQKLYGPWLVYLNKGAPNSVISDARKHAEYIKKRWPFTWVQDANYPLQRFTVDGKLGNRQGEAFNVVLSPQAGDPEMQTLGFLYATVSDTNGAFKLSAVRPGSYWLTVYSATGYDQGILLQNEVKIDQNGFHLGEFDLPAAKKYVWHIGVADKTAAGFKFAEKPRNVDWADQVPADLVFNVGQQTDGDWYYAQTQPGDWKIFYTEEQIVGTRILNLAFASTSSSGTQKPASPKLAVMVNGQKIADIAYSNDKSIYRGSVLNGQYHNESITIPEGVLHKGKNEIVLRVLGGAFMYDAINLEQK
ncbi:polysaccharide lyase family protein [Uliginosibacterium gangwonense]|uniref:polysaccharide lyase family protein n=1 Tax=Uliginosibacterium gangwonense TaxID=392736 RepID=UPI0003743936|nr:polysaccharide lyase family protein [Uliginosibacterium gangwonense]